jgi:hypothetical protein
MLPQTAKSVAYFYSATLAWNVSAIDREDVVEVYASIFHHRRV